MGVRRNLAGEKEERQDDCHYDVHATTPRTGDRLTRQPDQACGQVHSDGAEPGSAARVCIDRVAGGIRIGQIREYTAKVHRLRRDPVEPAADFGNEHGILIVSDAERPDQVVVDQADRAVYVPVEWVDQVVAGVVPWAELVCEHPWRFGGSLKIRGEDGVVIYVIVGACGPTVHAYLLEQPDLTRYLIL